MAVCSLLRDSDIREFKLWALANALATPAGKSMGIRPATLDSAARLDARMSWLTNLTLT